MNNDPSFHSGNTAPLPAVVSAGHHIPWSWLRKAWSSLRLARSRQPQPVVALIRPDDESERAAEAMENWFHACSTDEAFSVELVGTPRQQGFFLRASSQAQFELLSKQLEAQYPQVDIQRLSPLDDPLSLRHDEYALIGEFALAQPAWMPLRTYPKKELIEPGNDPLAGLLAAMEPLASNERVIAQLSLMRAPDTWISPHLRKAVEHPLQPERDAQHRDAPDETAEGVKLAGGVLALLGILFGLRWYRMGAWFPLGLLLLVCLGAVVGWVWWQLHRNRHEIYDMRLVDEKMKRTAFYTQLRVIAIGQETVSSQEALRTHLDRLETAYRQFSLASANSLYLRHQWVCRPTDAAARTLIDPRDAFPYRTLFQRLWHSGAPGKDIWNALELAGAFHLPQRGTDVPLVARQVIKRLLFSPAISYQLQQQRAPLPPVCIGTSRQRGRDVEIVLPFETLFAHKVAFGKSRSGKSTVMTTLIEGAVQPVTDGTLQPGVVVIDPHQDLIEGLLGLIPEERLQDVILLDLSDKDYPVGINPLDASAGFSRDEAISNLISNFERIWSNFWGPRMSYFLHNVLLTLYTLNEDLVQAGRAEEQFTLLDVNPLLLYPHYTLRVLNLLDLSKTWHQEVLSWWNNVFGALPKQSAFRQEVLMPIISKLAIFSDNQRLRLILGQPCTSAPIQKAITEGKIVLCAMASRDLDEASINILGSTLVNMLHRAFAAQHSVPIAKRRRVFVAADEFHAFGGANWDRLLSEDGKYGCSLLLATQELQRLQKVREGLLELVLANCENLFVFQVSGADARVLEQELHEKVPRPYILRQPRLHCYTRLALPGFPPQIASCFLRRPASWQPTAATQSRMAEVRKLNRQRQRARADVEQHHQEHLRTYLRMPAASKTMRREVDAMDAAQQRNDAAQQQADYVQAMRAQAQGASVISSTPTTRRRVEPVIPAQGAPLPGSNAARDAASSASRSNGFAPPVPPAGTPSTSKPPQENLRRSRRLRRLQKDYAGAPPPEIPEQDDGAGKQAPSSAQPPVFEAESNDPEDAAGNSWLRQDTFLRGGGGNWRERERGQ